MIFSQSSSDCEWCDVILEHWRYDSVCQCSRCGTYWRNKGNGPYVPGIFEMVRLRKSGVIE